mmetsp:Transcript_12446/g.17154  ORF Transcript_12446/g.17154 Transcript_12446/m.17154 type:complete len:190 (+) Transcript_12446:643-1212(+)
MKHEESEVQRQKEELEKTANDESLGIVKRNRAKAMLAMKKNEDSLPFAAAKLQNEAAVKKLSRAEAAAGKAAKDAEIALANAEKAEKESRQARKEAIETGKAAEAIIPIASEACSRVQVVLNEVLAEKKAGKGTIFYIERELQEAKKFLPRRKFAVLQKEADNARKEAMPENENENAHPNIVPAISVGP